MFNQIRERFAALYGMFFSRRSLADILGDFEVTRNELNVLASDNDAEVAANEEAMALLAEANEDLIAETVRSRKIVSNITSLLGEEE